MHIEHDVEKINRVNFRSCLEAMARPGQRQEIVPLFGSGILAMASVLLYAEVSHFYAGTLDFKLIRALCGSPLSPREKADYLFFDQPDKTALEQVKKGSPENPEESATLIFGYDDSTTTKLQLRLTGPGINGSTTMAFPGDEPFIRLLRQCNESFPMGIDIFIISGAGILTALPRTTALEVLS